jgi:Alpha/beta hydrolase domain
MERTLTVTPVAGKPNLLLGAYNLADAGYRADEYFVSGSAASFAPAGDLGPDGQWSVTPDDGADYTTRVVVLTPTDQTRFNGTVLVEWLNVSGGIDAPAAWFMTHREAMREGYAYVAVSTQRVGVEGGLSLGMDMSLKAMDPARYGPLQHPGDAFSYDIFSQAGRLARDGLLAPLHPEHVVGVGESQSAIFLTTYINAVDPHAEVYDGYFVLSRFGPAAPLDGSSVFDELDTARSQAVRFRPDVRVPTLAVITETDLMGGPRLGYLDARTPDGERLRTWEITGAAHADVYTINVAPIDSGSASVDALARGFAPCDTLMGYKLDYSINFAPQHHYVLQGALAALQRWIKSGTPAPSSPPLEVAEARLVTDANGLARGGVRTPWVDVPVAKTSGLGPDGVVPDRSRARTLAISDLFGSGEFFDADMLAGLYPGGSAAYLEQFAAALDAAIAKEALRPADRAEILGVAEALYPGAVTS